MLHVLFGDIFCSYSWTRIFTLISTSSFPLKLFSKEQFVAYRNTKPDHIFFFFFTNVKASLNIHNMLHFSTLNVYKQLLLKHFDDGVMYPKCFLQCSYSEKCCSG